MNQTDFIFHDASGGNRTETTCIEASQTASACITAQNLTKDLMKEIATSENLKRAFKSVKKNKGAAGIDRMSIKEVEANLNPIIERISHELLTGQFRPLPVRHAEILKPDGNIRNLGIPTVVDRMVQQAIVQILSPIIDPTFSDLSFGFRPNRSAKDAIKKASLYVSEGRIWCVDIDLEHFFDQVNHDKLMHLVSQKIQDKSLLRLIRRFLTAGVMQNGICRAKERGTPQGGPLSPLLSNILLHQLDLELERRGHNFCRYADDCNIYVQSLKAAKRVLQSITSWIEKHLKLKVNQTKSAADKVDCRKFLGYTIYLDGSPSISKQAIARFKDKVRRITKRNRGISIEAMITELNGLLRGWFHYFKWSSFKSIFRQLDCWIRRKLRCFRIKQRKRKYSIKTFLQAMGIEQPKCWNLACSNKGWWRKAFNPVIHQAIPDSWFDQKGLFNLLRAFVLHQSETAVCDIARTVV